MPAAPLKKPIEMREADFTRSVAQFVKYPPAMRQEFTDYWTEKTRTGTQMRFESEKTWDLSRRLARWANNNFGTNKPGGPAPVVQMVQPKKEPTTDIERLDHLLSVYRKNPSYFKFDDLAAYYQPIKDHRLWPPTLTKGQVNEIRELYKGNDIKCKAWVVERTLMYYENQGWSFENTIEARKKLSNYIPNDQK